MLNTMRVLLIVGGWALGIWYAPVVIARYPNGTPDGAVAFAMGLSMLAAILLLVTLVSADEQPVKPNKPAARGEAPPEPQT